MTDYRKVIHGRALEKFSSEKFGSASSMCIMELKLNNSNVVPNFCIKFKIKSHICNHFKEAHINLMNLRIKCLSYKRW